MRTDTQIKLYSSLFILLFVYTAISKLIDFEEFERQMYKQAIPHLLAGIIIWTLPAIEIFTAFLLLSPKARFAGFVLSALLMAVFTGYVSLAVLHVFPRVPCSCGGVIKGMGWKIHLVFNLIFLLVSVSGVYITYKERRSAGN
jgi:putative oxidoreductase